jgi:coenzyme F420-reducing hydrogenase beta subunit
LAELLRSKLIDAAAHVAPVADPQSSQRFLEYHNLQYRSRNPSRRKVAILSDRDVRSAQDDPIVSRPVRRSGYSRFVKAVQLLRRIDRVIGERVAFTLGLFCGHMKSARLIESFAWQMDVPISGIQSVEFAIRISAVRR